jgi:hypothetical protein
MNTKVGVPSRETETKTKKKEMMEHLKLKIHGIVSVAEW